MFNRIFSPQTMEIQILNSIPYTSFSCFSGSNDNKIENFLDKDNPKTYSYIPQEITDSIKFDGYEEDLYLKINSFPIIKDEDKSFFYKCACLYKTEEYKKESNITNSIVEFLYEDNNEIEHVKIIIILLCSIIPFTIFFNNSSTYFEFFLSSLVLFIGSFFLIIFIICFFLSIKAKKVMKIYERRSSIIFHP